MRVHAPCELTYWYTWYSIATLYITYVGDTNSSLFVYVTDNGLLSTYCTRKKLEPVVQRSRYNVLHLCVVRHPFVRYTKHYAKLGTIFIGANIPLTMGREFGIACTLHYRPANQRQNATICRC